MFLGTLAIGLLAAAQPQYSTDTTIAVERGVSLALNGSGGTVSVKTWSREAVRLQAKHSSRTNLAIRLDGKTLVVEPVGRLGLGGDVDFELVVPSWLGIQIEGMSWDVEAAGLSGSMRVTTLNGDLKIFGGTDVTLETLNGDIQLEEVSGRVKVSTMSGDVVARKLNGEVRIEAVSGDIRLIEVESERVVLETVSGDVVYGGGLRSGGVYSLVTHSGDITLGLGHGASAQFRVSMITGDFHSAFNLEGAVATSGRRRTQNLRLGSGSATVELETYSGDIQLVPVDQLPNLDRPASGSSRRRERLELDDLLLGSRLVPLWEILNDLNIEGMVNRSMDLPNKIRVVIPSSSNSRWEDQ